MCINLCCSRIQITIFILSGVAAVGCFLISIVEELLLYKQVSHKSVLFTVCVHMCFELFSVSLGQLISDRVTEIVAKYDSKVYSTKYDDQLATRPASAAFDDSYLGM